MALIPPLPFDILEYLIDKLADDKASLYQCATVSNQFLFITRKHIFSSIYLGQQLRYPRCACARLSAILSKSPHLVSSVKVLRIFSGRWTRESTLPSLLHRIACANRLEGFLLTSLPPYTWDSLNLVVQRALRHLLRCTTLCSLDINGSITRNFPISLVASAPALAHLTYSEQLTCSELALSSNRYNESLSSTQVKGPCAILKSVAISGSTASRLVQYLTQLPSPIRLDRLRELYVDGPYSEVGDTARRLIEATSGSLEFRQWRHWRFESLDGLSVVNLGALTQLKSVELRFVVGFKDFEWLACLLQNWGMPRSVERVTFVLLPFLTIGMYEMHTRELALQGTWGLDAVLAALGDKEAFQHLAAFEVQMFEENDLDDEQRRLYLDRNWFPKLKRMGCLEFVDMEKYDYF